MLFRSLAARLGWRTLMVVSVIGFTTASMLCGLVSSLESLLALRVLQGARTSYNSLKDDAPGAADLANNLAFALERQSSGLPPDRRAAGLAEAVGQYEQALALHGRVYGDDHSITIDTRNSLALALMKTGQAPARERAEALLQENLRRVRTNRPPEEVVQALNTLSKQVLEAGDIEQALRLSEQVMQGARGFYEPGREPILRTGKLRGEILRKAKRQPEAETLLRELLRDRLAWIAAHGQPAYDRLALDVASDLQGVLVEQGAFDRLPEVLATCDPIAAAGDDVKNEAKYLYLRQKAASLAAWAAQDPSKQA